MKKVLCLHGYSMNATWFHQWLYQIEQYMEHSVELVFAQGPHECNEQEVLALWQRLGVEAPLFRWRPGRHFCWFRYGNGGSYQGVEQSLEYLNKLIEQQGPFAGVFGWSQGVMMSLILLAEHQRQGRPLPFDWMVLGAGGLPKLEPWKSALQLPLTLPTLHIVGEQESATMRARCNTLLAECKQAELLLTPAGHQLPLDDEKSLRAIAAWLDKNIR